MVSRMHSFVTAVGHVVLLIIELVHLLAKSTHTAQLLQPRSFQSKLVMLMKNCTVSTSGKRQKTEQCSREFSRMCFLAP